ncbi:MAG: acyltransferase, partial [Pseudomonadota bacterium]
MTSKTLPAASTHAAFLAELEASDDHIVDRLIKERCPSFVDHWSWPVVRPMLYALLGYDRACRTSDYLQTLNGGDSFDHLTEELA